jgi:uncharacterized protein YbaR (Trm112 family)
LGVYKLKYRLLDLLACPECRKFPLKLHIIREIEAGRTMDLRDISETPACSIYCGFKDRFIRSLDKPYSCRECLARDIIYGVLVCLSCRRWYPIIAGIPIMYPDYIRLNSVIINTLEKIFLRRFRKRIPSKILEKDPLRLIDKLS